MATGGGGGGATPTTPPTNCWLEAHRGGGGIGGGVQGGATGGGGGLWEGRLGGGGSMWGDFGGAGRGSWRPRTRGVAPPPPPRPVPVANTEEHTPPHVRMCPGLNPLGAEANIEREGGGWGAQRGGPRGGGTPPSPAVYSPSNTSLVGPHSGDTATGTWEGRHNFGVYWVNGCFAMFWW